MIIETRLSSSGQKITLANIAETIIRLTGLTSLSIKQHSPSASRNQDYLQSVRMANCAVRAARPTRPTRPTRWPRSSQNGRVLEWVHVGVHVQHAPRVVGALIISRGSKRLSTFGHVRRWLVGTSLRDSRLSRMVNRIRLVKRLECLFFSSRGGCSLRIQSFHAASICCWIKPSRARLKQRQLRLRSLLSMMSAGRWGSRALRPGASTRP